MPQAQSPRVPARLRLFKTKKVTCMRDTTRAADEAYRDGLRSDGKCLQPMDLCCSRA